MGQVFKTPLAKRQLKEITAYIANDNLAASLQWLSDVEALFTLLAEQPGIGQIVQTRRYGNIRRRVIGRYLIYYRPIDNGVVILTVVHGSRDQNRLV